MSGLDWCPVLLSVVDYFPTFCLPELSWACRSLRILAIARAKTETVDLDLSEIQAGRWLLHHGAAIEPSEGVLTLHSLQILATTNTVALRKRSSLLGFITPVTWLAARARAQIIAYPTEPVKKHLLEFMLEHNPVGYAMIFHDNFLSYGNHYVQTWDTEAVLVLFENATCYSEVRSIISILEQQQQTHRLSDLALAKGSYWFEACYPFVRHPISEAALPKLVQGNIDRCIDDISPDFALQLLSHGYISEHFTNSLMIHNAKNLKRLVSRGYEITDALLVSINRIKRSRKAAAYVRKLVGDDRYTKFTPVPVTKSMEARIPLEQLDIYSLSREGALQALRLHPERSREDLYVQKLLQIAAKRKSRGAESSRKRRKRSTD